MLVSSSGLVSDVFDGRDLHSELWNASHDLPSGGLPLCVCSHGAVEARTFFPYRILFPARLPSDVPDKRRAAR